MELGIYHDRSIEWYHGSDGESKTRLCQIDEAPAVYRWARDHGSSKETKSLRLGTALHTAMEGTFFQIYAIGPDAARNTKVWKEFEAAHQGKICLKPDEAEPVLQMRAAILRHRPGAELLTRPGRFEVSYFWVDPATGLLCKCRPDWISANQLTIIDFKTARDVSHAKFQKAAYDLHYFVSAAMTMEGVFQTTGILPERYIFLCVQPTAPFLVAAYEATADEIALGREFVSRNLTLLKYCLETGEWPGLPEEIRPLGLPRHAPKPGYAPDPKADLIHQLEREFSDVAS
ncbi:MAG: PD-(D/E)XK nuclease-like domain-containing protein [Pseudobdellovibrionaceae bacterium]|nr:PD-(D/E)XK nuclease-like domain-containing protein [Pseudobdellovibrionaceae bacterium]